MQGRNGGASAAKLRAILDSAVDGIITIDEHGAIQDINPAVSRLFGYGTEELTGQNVKLLMPEPYRGDHDGYLQNYLSTGRKKIIGIGREVEGLRKDGSTFPMHLSVSEFDLEGRQLFAGIVHDLSERKKAVALGARMGRIIEGSLNEVFLFDVDSLKFIQVNRSARDNLGYSLEELLELTPVDIKPELSRESFERLIQPLRDGEKAQIQFDTTHQRKNGTTYPTEVHLQLSREETPPIFVAIIQDRTERRQSQETLLLRERAIEAIESGILITDARQTDGPIIYANPAIERMTGFTPEELIGRNPRILQGQDREQPELEIIRAALAHDKPANVILRNYRKDGTKFLVNVQISPVRNDKGAVTHHVGVQVDVTDRKIAEDKLRYSQRMDAVGQLTGGVAHDFNNLLTVISGNLEMLEPKITDERQRIMVEHAQEATELGATLTRRLLAFARRQSLEPKEVNVNELVLSMTELLRRTLGEAIKIGTVLENQLWSSQADPGQLENAIINLAINARDAMPDGGMLTIETTNKDLDTSESEPRPDIEPGRYVVLSVSDTGAGMDDETKERAFDPFFTTKETGAGTGLGLSMIYGFAKQTGGHLAIYSELGYGTTVSLYLPRLERDESKTEAGAGPVAPSQATGETILVVEDNERVRQISVMRLEDLGYRVLEADCGQAALDLLASGQQVDLLFTDIVMPGGMNGRELAEAVQNVDPGMKVLFTSGYAEAGAVGSSLLESGALLIRKPYKTAELAAKVREALTAPH